MVIYTCFIYFSLPFRTRFLSLFPPFLCWSRDIMLIIFISCQQRDHLKDHNPTTRHELTFFFFFSFLSYFCIFHPYSLIHLDFLSQCTTRSFITFPPRTLNLQEINRDAWKKKERFIKKRSFKLESRSMAKVMVGSMRVDFFVSNLVDVTYFGWKCLREILGFYWFFFLLLITR